MNRVAIYPGSFDPVTNGHLDVIRRAATMFDNVVVAIAHNMSKTALFSPEERATLIREIEPRVEVSIFDGLLVEYVHRRGASIIIRGLRAVADFEYEFQLALMNRRLVPEVDTVFLMTDERNFYISSSLVKEVASLGGDVTDFVPGSVSAALELKLAACRGEKPRRRTGRVTTKRTRRSQRK
jgi:pantetheine-phosphate adenylyltransferase